MTKPRQLTYMERTARFPLDFDIVLDAKTDKLVVKVPLTWETGTLVRLGPYDTGKLKFSPRAHLHAAPVLSAFFAKLKESNVLEDILTYDGGYVARLKRGAELPKAGDGKDAYGKLLSNHSRGTAVDLNAAQNPMGHPGAAAGQPGCMARIAAIASTIRVDIETPHGHIWPAGIVWGGDWAGASRDDMHLELGTFEP